MKHKNTKKTYETVLFLNKSLFSKSESSLLKTIGEKVIRTKNVIKIFTPNPEQFVLASEDKEFSRVLDQADILLPDGIGVVFFSKLAEKFFGKRGVKERITGVDVVQKLLQLASDRQWKVLLVGGQDYEDKLHNISITGLTKEARLSLLWNSGYENIARPTKAEEDNLVKLIKQQKPELVFVGFGAPWQEKWIVDHEELLTKSKVKLAMAVGGSFDMLFGKLKRAPMWLRIIGLEWFFRLVQQPSRWRRQLKLIKFVRLATADLFKKDHQS